MTAAAAHRVATANEPRVMLRLRDISKSFSGVQALSSVNLDVRAGEVLGLLGQNGAGKSTLVRIVSGAETPSAGEILVDGAPVQFRVPGDALTAGIFTIYQELSLVPQLSVAENVYLSRLPRRGGLVDWPRLRRTARETLESLGFDIDVDKAVADLPLAQRQAVEIAKAVHHRAKVVLLDEPTATLPRPDVAKLFELIRRLRSDGVGILYISHRLDEIYDICDRISVLRDGQHIATRPTSEVGPSEAVRLMVGEGLAGGLVGQLAQGGRSRINVSSPRKDGPPALEVRSLSDEHSLRDVSLTVMPGEAVAVTGLVGSGQSELAACIFGIRPRTSGEVFVGGREIAARSPGAVIRAGLGWLPEERKLQGLVLEMSVGANLTLANLRKVAPMGLLRRRVERKVAQKMVQTLGVKTAGIGQKVSTLSGGNQQKIVFGKWLLANTRTMIFSEPTRGIDVAAKEEIYREMRNFLSQGGSVLVLSAEIDEALMCDRIYVINRGHIVATFAHEGMDPDRLVELLR